VSPLRWRGVDSTQHTLKYCPVAVPRHALTAEIGTDLSSPAIMRDLLVGERTRSAVTFFCERVMLRGRGALGPPHNTQRRENIDADRPASQGCQTAWLGNQTLLHGGTVDGPRCVMTAHRVIRM
jgi:hypothetical protein